MAPSGWNDLPPAPKQPKTNTKTQVPYRQRKPQQSKRQTKQLVEKLSIRDWDVDSKKVMEYLTGEKPNDEHERLVP